MQWHNLRTGQCPFCAAKLIHNKQTNIVDCSECRFTIDYERMRSIAAHRSKTDKPIARLKWQNVHDDKCPACGEELIPNSEGKLAFLKCMNAECTFKISEEAVNTILADERHPCNIFQAKQ